MITNIYRITTLSIVILIFIIIIVIKIIGQKSTTQARIRGSNAITRDEVLY